MKLDRADKFLLMALQENSSQSMSSLSEQVGLSASAIHRRIKILEDAGIINGYSARLNAKALGYSLTFFVEITLQGQNKATLEKFEKAIKRIPEIQESYLMAGTADYLVKIVARSTEDYERIHSELSSINQVARVQTSMILRTVQEWKGFTVEHMG